MKIVHVDSITFSFPDNWAAEKYDDWNFYRKHFQKLRDGVKAVDIIAFSPQRTLFLIEVKDYSRFPRTKSIDITAEICAKVFDTLAALLPAKMNATDSVERNFAIKAVSATSLKVILHLRQPKKQSTLRPQAIDPASVKAKLRQALKAIDRYPQITDDSHQQMGWTVT